MGQKQQQQHQQQQQQAPAFDLFNVVDQDKTNFYFLCDPNNNVDGDGDGDDARLYVCNTCERLGDKNENAKGIVGSFDCVTAITTTDPSSTRKTNSKTNSNSNCYEIDSRCPNTVMTVCSYDTLKRTMYNADNTN